MRAILVLLMAACSGPAPSSSATPVEPLSASTSTAAAPAGSEAPGEAREATGVVRHRQWSQSVESWEAGGSDYFVLEVGEDSVILRETEAVPRARLEALVDQRVNVTGTEAPYFVPEVEPTSNYPMGMDGQPLPRGGGIQVATIAPAP